MRDADKVAYQYADATHTTFCSQSPQWTMMASNAISLLMTSKPTGTRVRWPYTDGQLFLAMMTAEVKFSPRYAKVFIRTKRLYIMY